jgi:hypothetical protein
VSFPIGDHLSGSRHARAVQAELRNLGGGRDAFHRVVTMAWLPLEGEDFNTVLGIFRPHQRVVEEEEAEAEEEVEDEEWEDPESDEEEFVFAHHTTGTMVDGTTIVVAGREPREPSMRDALCPVCLNQEALLAIVPCGHMVCPCCWLLCRDRCPLCRCEGRGLELRWP